MNYLTFLIQWYNWPYVAGLLLVLLSIARPAALGRVGARMAAWLGLKRVSDFAVVRVFGVSLALVGLTVNGGLHDYWPAAQEGGFLPGLVVTLVIAALATRLLGKVLEQHFPPFKSATWGARHLSGREGRVVSRMVSADYKAGRAHVMGDDETLHTVMCKTRGNEVPLGAIVLLGEYDEEDGRYYVEPVGDRPSGDGESEDEADEAG